MGIFENHKERIVTGLALVAGVLLVGFIDNFFLMWLVLGVVYILAFNEAMALFKIRNFSVMFCLPAWNGIRIRIKIRYIWFNIQKRCALYYIRIIYK